MPAPAAPLVRAVLFDLDGVLVDSFELWLHVVNVVAQRFGAPAVARERLLPIFGQGVTEDARNLYPGRTPAEIQAAYDEVMPDSAGKIGVNPEGPAVLEGLRARGIVRALVTNTQATLVPPVLRAAGVEGLFDACVGLTPKLREKPAPDLLVEAMRLLRVRPAETLMVGDTDYDARAAKAAGTAFLRYKIRSGARLSQALATHLPA